MSMKLTKTDIISIIALIISAVSLYIAFNPLVFKPNLDISTNYGNNAIQFSKASGVDFLLYVYNGGNGPCVGMRLKYPSDFLIPSIRPQKIFRMYTDIKDEVKDTFNATGFICGGDCPIGILPPNEVLVIDFSRTPNIIEPPEKFNLTVTCSTGQDETIDITSKK